MFDFVPSDSVKIVKNGVGYIVGELTKTLPHSKFKQESAICIRANSVKTFIRMIETEYPKAGQGDASTDIKTSDGFHTLDSWSSMLDTYKNRPSSVRNFKVIDKNIKMPSSVGNEVFYDVEGDWLDIDRYLEGSPEVFGQSVMGNPTNVFANIVVNVSATWDFDEAVMRRRGERLIRIIDWLEAQNIRTRVMVFGSNQCYHLEVIVKDYHDMVDLDAIGVALHTDFFRRLVFRVMEHSKTFRYGYGTATQVADGRMKMPKMESNGLLIFSENRKTMKEVDDAFDNAEKVIEQNLEEDRKLFDIHS